MADKLIIVESPSKASTIKKYLSGNTKVVASVGHVRDLPKSKMGIDIENDFEPEYINIRGKSKLINDLKKDAKEAKEVFLATDPDREGEAIAWHLATLLEIPLDTLCRVTFNEITKSTVQKSIKEPRTIDMNLTDSQQARRVLDRIVGYKVSPILWKKGKRGLSAGRVQSVAVKLIVDREEEIEKFIPEEYWNIYVILSKNGNNFEAKFYGVNDKKQELHKKEEVDEILKNIENGTYKVSEVKLGSKKRTPAPPFTTSTMQQEASRKLGFALRRTMSVAQSLYEKGYITYMRTDSTRISDEARAAAKQYIEKTYGKEYYENRFYRQAQGIQDGHEGIRPTDIENIPGILKEELTSEELKLYTLVYNRFIASQMAAAEYDTVSAKIDCTGSGKDTYNFKVTGQTLKFKGFMTLYVEDKDEKSDEDEELSVPVLENGETLNKESVNGKQSFTEPPARYTEASLVKALEEKGIGRPSTYATIISTILDREYVDKEQKQLKPTNLGKAIDKYLEEYFKDIVNVEFTAEIEDKLDKVAEGTMNWKEVIREFYGPFEKELEKAEKTSGYIEVPSEVTDIKCSNCGKNMVVKQSRFGKFLACPGYPECKTILPYSEAVDTPCPVCGSEVYKRKSKRGKAFYICSKNNKDEKEACPYISWNKPKVGEVWDPNEAEEHVTKKSTSKKKTTKKVATKKTTAKKKTTTKKKK